MFKFIDQNYNESLRILNTIWNKRLLRKYALITFFILTVMISLILYKKGWLMLISIPASIVITFISISYMKKNLPINYRGSFETVTTTFTNHKIHIEVVYRNKQINNSEMDFSKIVKIIETYYYYFFFDSPKSAMVINKATIMGKDISDFHNFILNEPDLKSKLKNRMIK